MRRAIVSLLSLALASTAVTAASADPRAAQLLAQARDALGGDAHLSKVQALSLAGTVQRVIGDRQIEGELTLDLQLPDRMWRTESISPMGDGALIVTGQGINGDRLLRSMRTINAPPGAVIRTPPPPPAGSDAEAQALRNSRAELIRLTLALLLAPPASVPLEFTAAGQAEAPDGRADVLDVKGANGFAARLFLDATSHRPLMLTYRGIAPRVVVRTQSGPAPGPARPDEGPDRAAQLPAGEMVEITMFLDDYKAVDGVLLPHHVMRSVDDKPNEEWTFKMITLNPAFGPDAFSGK